MKRELDQRLDSRPHPAAEHIAFLCTQFITECRAHSLTDLDIHQIIGETLGEYEMSGDPAKDFLTVIRRQQVINKVATTCERLRRGTAKDFKV